MTSNRSAIHSDSHEGLLTNPDSSQTASQNSDTKKQTDYSHTQVFDKKKGRLVWKKEKFVATFPIDSGRGMSNLNSNWKTNFANDPLFKKVISVDSSTGDKMEFRNKGTKLKYRKTFEQDGSVRKSHKLNFPHFVIIRNFKKKESKNC